MENEKVCTGNTYHDLFLPKLKSFCSKPGCPQTSLPIPARGGREGLCVREPWNSQVHPECSSRKGSLPTVDGSVSRHSHCGKQSRGSSKKLKKRVAVWSKNPTPGYTSEQNYLKRYMHSYVHSSNI